MKLSAKRILKEIGCPHLKLYRGEGYWYFIYEDSSRNLYEGHTVYSCNLDHLSFEQWVQEGKEFVESMKTINPFGGEPQ